MKAPKPCAVQGRLSDHCAQDVPGSCIHRPSSHAAAAGAAGGLPQAGCSLHDCCAGRQLAGCGLAMLHAREAHGQAAQAIASKATCSSLPLPIAGGAHSLLAWLTASTDTNGVHVQLKWALLPT